MTTEDETFVTNLAERTGFEPAIELPQYTLSKRAPSTTRPSLHARYILADTRDETCLFVSCIIYAPLMVAFLFRPYL